MKILYTVIFLFLGISQLNAWIYPEHREIALLAIQKLSPEYRAIMDKLWADARVGYELRLTEAVIDATLSVEPTQLDFASWPAISGDHPLLLLNHLSKAVFPNKLKKYPILFSLLFPLHFPRRQFYHR